MDHVGSMEAASSNRFPLVGIMGGGQLGRMMALAAIRMGLQVRFLSPTPSGSMQGLGEQIVGDWHDPAVLKRFAEGCAVVTVESEWAPAEHIANMLPDHTALWPSPGTLSLIRDKGIQKNKLADAGLPVPLFTCCTHLEDAQQTAAAYGYPVLLKRLKGSYDGYGNATVHNENELAKAWPLLADEQGLMVEAWVPFVRELSVLVARRPGGKNVVYPVAYTEQRDHRCHAVVVPADIPSRVREQATEIGLAAVEAVDGVGITAVELFELEDQSILINELAPRPHNTGHYSIEGCYASQFENHIRAILDWPLGCPDLREPAAVMINVLGHNASDHPRMTGFTDALAIEGAAVHIYGKEDVRAKRKMGHVTVTGTDAEEVRSRAERAVAFIKL